MSHIMDCLAEHTRGTHPSCCCGGEGEEGGGELDIVLAGAISRFISRLQRVGVVRRCWFVCVGVFVLFVSWRFGCLSLCIWSVFLAI